MATTPPVNPDPTFPAQPTNPTNPNYPSRDPAYSNPNPNPNYPGRTDPNYPNYPGYHDSLSPEQVEARRVKAAEVRDAVLNDPNSTSEAKTAAFEAYARDANAYLFDTRVRDAAAVRDAVFNNPNSTPAEIAAAKAQYTDFVLVLENKRDHRNR